MATTTHAKPLDFLVIGASKSGTTSLHHYLRAHPHIFLPERKELPYFTKNKEWYQAGWDAFVARFYADASPQALWGKVTPQYMSERQIPHSIHTHMPQVKLVALLRNPVDRAFSYYSMICRQGKENRSFAEVVNQQLSPQALVKARQAPLGGIHNYYTYMVRGEYARILGYYHQYFPPEQLFVVFTDDLKRIPQRTIDSILSYIGLPSGFVPPNLSQRYNFATEDSLGPFAAKVKTVPPISWVWDLLPPKPRRRVRRWGEQRLRTLLNPTLTCPPDIRAKLVDFYRPDVQKLEALLGRPLPWPEFY